MTQAAAVNVVAGRDDAAEGGPATDDALVWTESRYDTRVALERAKQVREGGFALRCVWWASRIRSSPHIDHCFSWARWRSNDLWCYLSNVSFFSSFIASISLMVAVPSRVSPSYLTSNNP